jgi:hypothetical protein
MQKIISGAIFLIFFMIAGELTLVFLIILRAFLWHNADRESCHSGFPATSSKFPIISKGTIFLRKSCFKQLTPICLPPIKIHFLTRVSGLIIVLASPAV